MRPWNSAQASSDVAHTAMEAAIAGSVPATGADASAPDHSSAQSAELAASPAGGTPDFTSVLDKIEKVRAMDPAAEQTLLAELRKSPPSSWPLVAEQFRASLAYREQLLSSTDQVRGAQLPFAVEPPNPFMEKSQSTTILPLGSSTLQKEQQIKVADSPPATALAVAPPISTLSSGTSQTAAEATTAGPSNSSQTEPRVSSEVVQASLTATTTNAQAQPAPTDEASEISIGTGTEAHDSNWQALVEQAAAELTRRAAPSPTTTAEVHQHVSLRILRLLAGDTEGALEPILRISPAEQDYWSKQLFALATYLDHHRQPDEKRRAAASVIHLDEAVAHLRELGSLSVRNLSFCKTVYGYGAIEPYDADRFSPGEQVSLYVEVENYHSKSTEKGFCTLLGSTYEILNEAGQRLGGGEIPDVNDCCRSRRRDFHIQYALALPQSLVPGRYQLQLVIKDRQSDKRGHATVAFEIKGAVASAQTSLIGS